jgi:hypothetical protein
LWGELVLTTKGASRAKWALIGIIGDPKAQTVCSEGDLEVVMFLAKELASKAEIKLSFEAPSEAVATIVQEVFNGDIPDVDTFIRDLGAYYGYRVRKKRK